MQPNRPNYQLAIIAIPPKAAARPIAAGLGRAASAVTGGPPSSSFPPAVLVVGVAGLVMVGIEEVKGTPPDVLVAPLKAGSWVEAAGFGVAVELAGFSTLFID